MSFSASFWHPDFSKDEGFNVVSGRLKRGKHVTEEFVKMVQDRAVCHDLMGDKLNAISKTFLPAEETGSMKDALDHVAQGLGANGLAQKQLANKLLNEVVAPLNRLLEDQAKGRAEGKKKIERVVKNREAQFEVAKKARKAYESKMKDAEAAKFAADRDPKLKPKSDRAEKSLTEATKDYQQSTELLATVTAEWSTVHADTCEFFEGLEKERLESLKRYLDYMRGLLSAMRDEEGKTLDLLQGLISAIDPSGDIQDFTKNSATGFSPPTPLNFEKIVRAHETAAAAAAATATTLEPDLSSARISIIVPVEQSPSGLSLPAPASPNRLSMDANLEEMINLKKELEAERREKENLQALLNKQEGDFKKTSKVAVVLEDSLKNERRIHHADMVSFLANVGKLLEEYEIEMDRFRPEDGFSSFEAPRARRAEKINGQISLLVVKLDAANLRNENLLEELDVMQATNDELLVQIDNSARELKKKDVELIERDEEVKRKDDRCLLAVATEIELKRVIADLERANAELVHQLEAANTKVEKQKELRETAGKVLVGEKENLKTELGHLKKDRDFAMKKVDELIGDLMGLGVKQDEMMKLKNLMLARQRPLDVNPIDWAGSWGISPVNAIVKRYTLDPKALKLTAQPESNAVLEIKDEPFDKGSFRFAYYARVGSTRLVLKEFMGSIGPAEDLKEHIEAVRLQLVAENFAKEYNNKKPAYAKTMRYCSAEIYTLVKGGKQVVMFAEELLEGDFVKFNNNADHVDVTNPAYEEAQSFSHFTWHTTSGQMVICDVQGSLSSRGFLLTDPACHLASGKDAFGAANLGQKGMDTFMGAHKCNRICTDMGLSRHPNQK